MKKKKTDSFWKPTNSKKGKPFDLRVKPVSKMKKKELNYPQAKRKYPKLNPYGDADRDGTKNWLDCKPFDKTRHSKLFRDEISKRIVIREEPRRKSIRGFQKDIKQNVRWDKKQNSNRRLGTIKSPPTYKLISKKDIVRHFEKNPDRWERFKKNTNEPVFVLEDDKGRVKKSGARAQATYTPPSSNSYGDTGQISIPILTKREDDMQRIIDHEGSEGHAAQQKEGEFYPLIEKGKQKLYLQAIKKPYREKYEDMKLQSNLREDRGTGIRVWNPKTGRMMKEKEYDVKISAIDDDGERIIVPSNEIRKNPPKELTWHEEPIENDAEYRRMSRVTARKAAVMGRTGHRYLFKSQYEPEVNVGEQIQAVEETADKYEKDRWPVDTSPPEKNNKMRWATAKDYGVSEEEFDKAKENMTSEQIGAEVEYEEEED